MLVIISDLHFTDGTTGRAVSSGAFEKFRGRLQEMAVKASWRSNLIERGLDANTPATFYEPIDSYDIVLLGDILDIVRSKLWKQDEHDVDDGIRPWDDPFTPDYVAKIDEILEAILQNNVKSFEYLRKLSDPNTAVEIPSVALSDSEESDPSSNKPTQKAKPTQKVVARIHYVVGNHDWFFHLRKDGSFYDAIRQKVIDALGLANPADQPFPHDPSHKDPATYTSLWDTYKDHHVYARHGDKFDSFNFNKARGTREAASIGDAIVVELINYLPDHVAHHLEEENLDNPRLIDNLREIANVRPNEAVPLWIKDSLEKEDPQLHDDFLDHIYHAWNYQYKQMVNLPFVKAQDKLLAFDIVNATKIAFNLSFLFKLPRFLFELVTGTGKKMRENLDFIISDFEQQARKEPLLQPIEKSGLDYQAHFIVYGHTHKHEIIPIGIQNGVQQIYFNSGTWKPLVQEIDGAEWGSRFHTFNVMTYLVFYKEDERKGRMYETWNGTLGFKPTVADYTA